MVEPTLPSYVSSSYNASVSDPAPASPEPGLQRSLTADFQTRFIEHSPVYERAFRNLGPKPPSKHALAAKATDASKDDSWTNKAVLCLDGGGVRGLSSLVILQRLMGLIADYEQQEDPQNGTSADSPLLSPKRIHNEMEELAPAHAAQSKVSKYLPCHYFDYIAGTSTGGLIAIMLGRLRMSVPTAIQEYRDLASRVFGERERKHLPQVRSLFHRRNNKEDILVEQIVRMGSSRGDDEPERIFNSDATRCRTIVCSLRKNQKGGSMAPFLFRSYDRAVAVDDVSHPAADRASLHISDVVRATVSPPDSLKSTRLGDGKFRDAGMGLNNPSIQVYQEVLSLHQQMQDSTTFDPVSLFLSIGCGFSSANTSKPSPDSDDRDKLTHLYSKVERALYAISESVHRKMEELHKSSKPFSYYRFDVPNALNSIALDKFVDDPGVASTFSRIEAATDSYLSTTHCQEYLNECAKNLVDRRRKRSKDSHWENFAFGTKYWCEHPGACNSKKPHGKPFETQDELLNHFRLEHLMPPPDADHDTEIKDLVKQGRTNSD